MIKIKNENSPILMYDILLFEKEYDIILPREYKSFLLKQNGGTVIGGKNRLEIYHPNIGIVIDCINHFYGISTNEEYNNLNKSFFILDELIDIGLLAIASTPGGNQICIGFEQNNFGEIFYWFHDLRFDDIDEEDEEIYIKAQTCLLSKNFTSFLEAL